jgi:hypothetical protein
MLMHRYEEHFRIYFLIIYTIIKKIKQITRKTTNKIIKKKYSFFSSQLFLFM